MRPETYLRAPRTAKFSFLSTDSSETSSSNAGSSRDAKPVFRRVVAMAMALLLLLLGQGELFAQQQFPPPEQEASQNESYNGQYAPEQPSNDGQQPYAQQGDGQAPAPVQPLNAVQLEQLVAPIALYPDTLVAEVLAASTYPAQVVEADRWRQAQGYASADQIAAGADAQTWDPSVKALTAFPQVLAQMDRNLQWTTDLGNAYYNQPQDVLEAVQVMRHRAQAAGNLQSTPQETVSYDQGNIELVPVNPQVVYVPAYNPWAVYGEPVSPYPGFSLLGVLGSFFGSSPISYGLGIAMTAFSHMSWGWLAWGLSWLSQTLFFNHSNYYSHSVTVADWGFPHGGPRAFPGWRPSAGPPNTFNRPLAGYGRPTGVYNTARGNGFIPRPPVGYGRPGFGYSASLGHSFIPRPPASYGRPGSGYNASLGHGFVPRPPAEAYNHTAVSRVRQYGRPAYGASSYNRPGSAYGRTFGRNLQ